MSLRVWLPLNGDLKNQGLDDITVTNNGATINSNGKIGSCYSFDGSAHYLQFDKSLTNLYCGEFSWALWVKPTDNTRGVLISEYSSTGSSNVALELLSNRVIRVYWNGSPDWSTGKSITKDVWSHIAVTRKENALKVYINGILVATKSDANLANRISTSKIRIGDDYRGGTSVSYMGYLNDVRIYDHCLSPAEVKEISRGLVLHYKLDDYIGKNLVNNCKNITTGWGKYTAVDSLTYENGRVKAVGASSGSPRIYNSTVLPYASTREYYTIYIDYECSSNIAILGKSSSSTTSLNENGAQTIGTVTRIKHIDLGNNHKIDVYSWYRLAATDTIKSSWWMISFAVNTTLYINSIKVEKGLNANIFWTPYNIEYPIIDSSGYNNNGIITGELLLNSESPKYKNSTIFNGSSYIQTISPSSEVKSISLWAKWNSIPSGQSVVFVDYKSKIGLGLMSTGILCSTNNLNTKTFNKSNIIANTWYHFVIVNPDNTNRDLYINGVKQTPTSNTSYWTYTSDYFQLGKRSTTSDGFNGEISDFRMYSAILSEEDVRQLYEVSGKIDNIGNIHSYEFEEYTTGRELLIGENFVYYSGGNFWNNFSNEGMEFQYGNSLRSNYIEINPDGNTYIYDFTVSIAAGNKFHAGFERFDANKTSRSNNACTYIISTKPATDIVKKRYRGVVTLKTDGVNPCKYIRLRVLNAWTGSNSDSTKLATIHRWSLREIPSSTDIKTKLLKQGSFKTDMFIEGNTKTQIEKNLITYVNEFIET